MTGRARSLAVALCLLAGPAAGDILLDGHQHMGNNDGRCEFTPDDPVTHDQIRDYPSNFHLSQDATITGVRLNNALGVDNVLEVRIDGVVRTSTCPSCTSCNLPGTITCGGNNSCGDVVINLSPGVVLLAGHHTISVRDANSSGNDFGFSSLTLLSPVTSSSVMLNQRRHPGNPTDPANDNDADDDYDINDPGSPYYPDRAEGHPLDIPFTLPENRRISMVEFFRVRDVDNDAPNQGQVLLDGQQIGLFPRRPAGHATETFNTNFLALAGPHTLRVALGVISGADVDSFSWDDIIIHSVTAATPGSLGAFNAVDVGEPALDGIIKTKIANKTFDLDLHAINETGTAIKTSYQGTVNVELLDASNDSGARDIYGCRSSWTVVHNLGSATFGAGNNGSKQLQNASYPNALRIARVRVTDTLTGARGCSTDALAIRPKDLHVDASDDDPDTPGLGRALPTGGYGPATTPVHKAGKPFTLVATPRGEGGAAVSGYTGQPTVTAIATELGAVMGTATITGAWTPSGGSLRIDTATYSEVGAVRLRVEDTSFADVDLADSTLAERTIKKDDIKVGRFVPDHFRVEKASLAPACGGFTYIGQPFGYPGGTAVTLTAEDALGATTLNYTGNLFKLASIPQGTFTIYDDPVIAGAPGLGVPAGNHAINDQGAGVGTILLPDISVVRAATPMGNFGAEIGITLPVFSDADGVLPAESPIVLGASSPGNGVPFAGAANQMRYGRLYIEPSFGSERADLLVPLRAEYFDGITFVPSTTDACTALATADVTLTPVPGASPAQTRTLAATGPGRWQVTLSAPNAVGAAALELDLATVGPYPFLLDDNGDGNGQYDNNPRGIANFGLYNRSQDNRIYQREVFR